MSRKSELEDGFDRTKQESFHLFVQCSKHPWEDHYHGKHACGKYLYMGKYRRIQSNLDDEIEEMAQTFLFSFLSEETKRPWQLGITKTSSPIALFQNDFIRVLPISGANLGSWLNSG